MLSTYISEKRCSTGKCREAATRGSYAEFEATGAGRIPTPCSRVHNNVLSTRDSTLIRVMMCCN